MLTENQLKARMREYDFRPLKRFGENYLIDSNTKDKIVAAAALTKTDIVLEIGPGLGALTEDIASSALSVTAVEIDRKARLSLMDLVKGKYDNLRIVQGDILKFDIRSQFSSYPIKVIGNLPYYITSPILEYLIGYHDLISSALILVQREVADRFRAAPGSRDRSSLSCFVQYFTRPEHVREISRTAFYPRPEVDSSLIRLEFLNSPSVSVDDEKLFFSIIRGAFGQRRKRIANSLSRKEVLDMPKTRLIELLCEVNVSPDARPEDLDLEQFAKIANLLSRQRV